MGWFERLTAIMAAMAEGDTTALGRLFDEYGDPLRGVVRRELARLNVSHLEAAEMDRPADQADEDVLLTLRRPASTRSDLRLLEKALRLVSRPTQQAILLEVRLQAQQGDPSPAATVARAHGLRPNAVRQTGKRLGDRLRRLAAAARVAPLADDALSPPGGVSRARDTPASRRTSRTRPVKAAGPDTRRAGGTGPGLPPGRSARKQRGGQRREDDGDIRVVGLDGAAEEVLHVVDEGGHPGPGPLALVPAERLVAGG